MVVFNEQFHDVVETTSTRCGNITEVYCFLKLLKLFTCLCLKYYTYSKHVFCSLNTIFIFQQQTTAMLEQKLPCVFIRIFTKA